MDRFRTPIALSAFLLLSLVSPASAQRSQPSKPEAPFFTDQPDPTKTAKPLLAYLNTNARRVAGLNCQVLLDVHCDGQKIGLAGRLACQRPRQMRVSVMCLGQPTLDTGSNEEEYWFWCNHNQPPLLRGRRCDEKGRGPKGWSFPCRPELLLDVLGLAEYDTAKSYTVKTDREYVELSEAMRSPQGRELRKVIVFHRQKKAGSQIAAIRLQDEKNRLLCEANIKQVYTDKATQALIAEDVVLRWPDDKIEVRVRLTDIKLEGLSPERAAVVFSPKSAPFAKRENK